MGHHIITHVENTAFRNRGGVGTSLNCLCMEIGAGRKLREKCKRGSKCNDENASAGVKVGSNSAGTISAHEFQGAATSFFFRFVNCYLKTIMNNQY